VPRKKVAVDLRTEKAKLSERLDINDVIEFKGWLPLRERPVRVRQDLEALLEMDLDGDILRGARMKLLADGEPPIRVCIKPGTQAGDVRRILKKVISAIEEHGFPEEFTSYGEMYLPPHIRHRLNSKDF